MKDTTDTVGQHNSTETAQQNCVKLCSYEGHNVQICIYTGNTDLNLLRSNFCPIARPQCLELPFIVYSILKQCWSVGYVSLLTLSFIVLQRLFPTRYVCCLSCTEKSSTRRLLVDKGKGHYSRCLCFHCPGKFYFWFNSVSIHHKR